MATAQSIGICPFCNFTDSDGYILLLHVEILHSEGESPFLVRNNQDENQPERDGVPAPKDISVQTKGGEGWEEEEYVTCPEVDCGESILASEFEAHVDMHIAERITIDDVEESIYGEKRPRNKLRKDQSQSETEVSNKVRKTPDGQLSQIKTSPKRSVRSLTANHTSTPQGWRGFLIRTGPSKSSTQFSRAHGDGDRRLGVRLFSTISACTGLTL